MNKKSIWLARGSQLSFLGRMITDVERAIGHFAAGNNTLGLVAIFAFLITLFGIVLVQQAINEMNEE